MSGWKRALLGVFGVATALGLAAGGLLAWTFSGTTGVAGGLELPGGGLVVSEGFVGTAIVPLPDGTVALVDAGNDPDAGAIRAALGLLGKTTDDVSAILLTHGHPDHVAGCAKFPFAATWALEAELPLLRGEVGSQGPLTRWFPPAAAACPRLQGAKDGVPFAVGGLDLVAHAVPGHTAGSAAWKVGPVLFVGDSADAATGGSVLPAKWIFTDDPDQNAAALRALAGKLDGVEVVVPSHSGPIAAGALAALATVP